MRALEKEKTIQPTYPVKKKKSGLVSVLFSYEGMKYLEMGKTIDWKQKYPSLKSAEQAIKDAWQKQKTRSYGLILLKAEVL